MPGDSGTPGESAAAAADLEETSDCCLTATVDESVDDYSKYCLLRTCHLLPLKAGGYLIDSGLGDAVDSLAKR